MRRAAVSIILGAIAATVGLWVSAEGVQLKGADLVNFVSGNTFTGSTRRGGTWEATYSQGGKLEVRVLNSDWSDSGTWEVKGDRVCSERTKRSYMCYEIMRLSDDEYHWIDDRRETSKSSGPK